MSDRSQRYRVLESLGKGGMGEVFLADDTQLGRKVALKFLPAALEHDPDARERFRREARSAAALDHPFICKIFEVSDVDGRGCIAMEYVVGETLQARLSREPLPMREVILVGTEVAEALEEAHKHQIVHRDLKPANIMLTEQGHVKVMDFGLAKHVPDEQSSGATSADQITVSGAWVGTPAYMSPEQVRGERVDSRSDIFSFGTLMYELIVAEHPFRRATAVQTMTAVLDDTPALTGGRLDTLPDTVRLALRKMLAKSCTDRYQSVADVRTDIGALSESALSVPRPAQPGAEATPVPSPTRRAGFVGRVTELGQLREALDRLASGVGSVVLIGGEPGVGKTRLTEQFVAEARTRGCLTLVGHCYETEGTPSYIPFVEILERAAREVPRAAFRESLGDAAPEVARLMPELRRLFDDIPPPIDLPPDRQRRYLFNAFQEFMERAIRVTPIVHVLEDLHWADEPTLLLLQHLAQQIDAIPFLIVGTYRDVELDVTKPFAKVLEALLRERQATRLPLRRLPEDEVGTLLEALGGQPPPTGLARTIYRETEGNPFFVEEVFQHLSEEGRLFDDAGQWRTDLRMEDLQVPEGVRLVIGRRLERVSDETRRALTVAAVIGRHFDLRVLEAAAADIDADRLLDALEEAEKAQLISSKASGRLVRYIFAHELIRQTLADNLSLPRRQRLHARVAEALEQVHDAAIEKHASQIAHHLYQSGLAANPDKTLRYLVLAADQALAASGFEEALGHIDVALSMEEGPQGVGRADLFATRGHALRSLGRAEECLTEWRRAIDLYTELDQLASLTTLCVDAAYILTYQDRAAEALDVCRRGLAVAGDQPSAARCRLSGAAGYSRALAGDYRGGASLLASAIQEAEALGDGRLVGELYGYRARMSYYYGLAHETVEACARGLEALDAPETAGDPWQTTTVQGMSLFGYRLLGRNTEVMEAGPAVRATADRLGHHAALFIDDLSRGTATPCVTGNLEQFEAFARGALETFGRAVRMGWMGHMFLGTAFFSQGRWEEALESLETGAQENTWEAFTDWSWAALLVAKAYAGHTDVLQLWGERRAHLPVPGEPAFIGRHALAAIGAEALVVVGAREEAASLHPIIVEFAAHGVASTFGPGASVENYAGIAAAAGEQWDVAQQHFETALRQAHEMPDMVAHPEVRRWYAAMLIERCADGDHDTARTLLGEAIEMYGTIGMPKHVELAEAMLQRIS